MTTQTIRHEVEVDTEIAAAHGAYAWSARPTIVGWRHCHSRPA